jgi:hypothetical protein
MQVIGKSIKIAGNFCQVAQIIDNYGNPKVQLKYFKMGENGAPNFKGRAQAIYFHPKHWKDFKIAIRGSKSRK